MSKIILATHLFLVANLCAAQEIYLTCNGVSNTTDTMLDEETRNDLREPRSHSPYERTITFIVKSGKIFHGVTAKEISNCDVDQYSIKCNGPLTETMKNFWTFYDLKIDRINGSFTQKSGQHTYGRKVNGRTAVGVSITYLDGSCNRTNRLAF